MRTLNDILNYKYEILLIGLVQHLFSGIFLKDLMVYTNFLWEINLIILGITSVGIFLEKGKWKNFLRIFLFIIGLALPLSLTFFERSSYLGAIISLVYFLFFVILIWEVLAFLIRPSYINTDIISASLCGYFLLIETGVFLMQFLFYLDTTSISNIDQTNPATVYVDLVYFCSIVLTTIGFGDIAPTQHNTKLATALLGIIGQFYSVVLVGILLSKFTTNQD